MAKKELKLVVLSGAGISAESGLKTFRDSDGLWENYKIEEVATLEAWRANPQLVQTFYNLRRKDVLEATPNLAHLALAQAQQYCDVYIVTQNIDNLHERAGSKKVLHLHGEITKAQSSLNPKLVYDIDGWELKMGDKCKLGSQLRPYIIWFGEAVPMMEEAVKIVAMADVLLVVGTSLQVYPAAGLINYAPKNCIIYLVDPQADNINKTRSSVKIASMKASQGVPLVLEQIKMLT
jgi:NAD-dependent deacetylase